MTIKAIITLLGNAEFLIWLAAVVTAWRAKLHRTYPAAICFITIKLLIAGAYSILILHYPKGASGAGYAYKLFFDAYWLAYLLATLAIFFSIEQIIRRVLSPLPGLSKLGVLVYRFTGALTMFIALTAHLLQMHSMSFYLWLQAVYTSFAMCMCVFEITLMSLLIATATRLGLSFRTRIFGLSLGICLLGLADLVSLASQGAGASRWAGLDAFSEPVTLIALLMWCCYFVLPEQRRGAMMLNRSSTLMRWNEIVSQLGIGPQPAVDATPSFMSDVEGVVTRIMERNRSGAV